MLLMAINPLARFIVDLQLFFRRPDKAQSLRTSSQHNPFPWIERLSAAADIHALGRRDGCAEVTVTPRIELIKSCLIETVG